jgi:hypothetical protein
MHVKKNISRLRYTSIFLFLTATIAIIGSLIFHNYIINFNFKPSDQMTNLVKEVPGDYFEVLCNKSNNYCQDPKLTDILSLKNNKLDSCFDYNLSIGYIIDRNKISGIYLLPDNSWGTKGKLLPNGRNQYDKITSKNFKIFINVTDEKNGRINECIEKTKHYSIYKIFPSFYEFIYKIKFVDKIILASKEIINPFLYGETSISNIVKRYPINYIFKSFLFLSSILMVLYWRYYNNFFISALDSKKNKFFIIGVFSALFLFLHVLFLGMEFDNKLFDKLRKLILLLFIFSELGAQMLLGIHLYKKRDILIQYCINTVIKIKYYFVLSLSFSTFIIIVYLISFKKVEEFNNILEWNYFIVLLFFYLFSFFLWKKNTN